jgi:hypothetical protein
MKLNNLPILFLVVLLAAPQVFASSSIAKTNCRQHIREILCLVGRTCLKNSSRYDSQVLAAYDQFPDFVQQAICGLKKIYIEKEFFGPAWSGLADDNDPTTGLVGIRMADLDSRSGLQKYSSWFEQQSFGGSTETNLKPGLPTVRVNPRSKRKITFLSYTLLHEMGHILDYQQKFNGAASPQNDWAALAWNGIQNPKPEFDFPMRKSICLNFCKGNFIPISRADELYSSIFFHGFASQLATLNAMEDFAETFSVYVAAKHMNIQFEIKTPTGKTYRLDEVISSPPLAKKMKYLKDRF